MLIPVIIIGVIEGMVSDATIDIVTTMEMVNAIIIITPITIRSITLTPIGVCLQVSVFVIQSLHVSMSVKTMH